MTRLLRFVYDDRDFLEVWLPEEENSRLDKREAGLYNFGVCAKNRGSRHAFDSLMVEAFSKAYSRLLAEVLTKEPPLQEENYEVPELGLYGVSLSQVLEEIYSRFVKKSSAAVGVEEILS